jgi:hypothetical protein
VSFASQRVWRILASGLMQHLLRIFDSESCSAPSHFQPNMVKSVMEPRVRHFSFPVWLFAYVDMGPISRVHFLAHEVLLASINSNN